MRLFIVKSQDSVQYVKERVRSYRIKKDGNKYARPNSCKDCDGFGYVFIESDRIAGLRFTAPDAKWVSANGFTTSKGNLDILESFARQNDMHDAILFLSKVKRLSALDTYLSSFVEGIKTHIKDDGKLHVRLLQHRTATGRFSGADPNMQNMPRGGTFPVKKVFVSRWEGGKIMEADFAQLSFVPLLSYHKMELQLKKFLLDLMYTATPLKLLPMLVSLRTDRLRRRILSRRYMERQAMEEQKRRQNTTHTSQRNIKASQIGIPDWLKRL